ncbi:MAG TPA: hypothetical protein DCF33_12285, partial [Saprospirales bacterium]|nr:hypothetical protein [Saprospirales bacterium]
MKKIQIWLFGFLLLGISVPSWAKIIYVNKNALGGNNGTSWINAYNELSQALPTAQYGDEVWVAQGTYKPYLEGITNSFNMISGVKLLGGFSGWETNQNQRNWKLNETILTAQYMVSQNGVVFPPYNIIYCIATDSTTLVDGFTFRDVLAGPFNGEPCAANQHNCFGGGIFLYSSTPTFPTYLSINNCRFLNNCCAAGGSAIGVNFSEGSGGFAIRHCYFNGNQALEGGALSIGVGSAPQHKMIIDSCIFEENNANTVGAISIYNGNVNLNFTISNSTFIKNTAKNGGCISHQSNNNVSPLKIKQSSFISNEAGDLISQPGTGGSILGRNFHISNCLFKQNKAFIGGAINADWLIIENSLFIDNLATREGGAIRTYLSNYFLNTTFVNNRTGLRGGAIFHGGFAGAHDTIIN